MKRNLFESDHKMFRDSFQAFLKREVAPYYPQWESEGIVPRELWIKAGQQGFLGINVPEEYGGAGVNDFRFNTVLNEELARSHFGGVGIPLHNDVVLPYLIRYATPEQKSRWLPGTVRKDNIIE